VAIAPETVWDAGVVARGAKIAHTFAIQNHGVEPLIIREVRPGCGCTVASFDTPIAPGGEGKVRVELDTEGLTGAIGKEVTAFTGDPANPMILFTIRAQVRASLDAQPGYYWFRHVQGAPAESSKQLVWSPDFQALEVTSATSTYSGVTVTVRPAQAAERIAEGRGKQWVVEATLAAEPPAGPISGEVKIVTNHPAKREIRVPLAGFVRSRLTVMPPAADFGTFNVGDPRRASVLVFNYGTAPIELVSVDTDVKGLVARIEEHTKGKSYDISLTLGPGTPRGPITGSLRVRTTSPEQPLLEVPVKGVAQ
jgi:hypothetical protein